MLKLQWNQENLKFLCGGYLELGEYFDETRRSMTKSFTNGPCAMVWGCLPEGGLSEGRLAETSLMSPSEEKHDSTNEGSEGQSLLLPITKWFNLREQRQGCLRSLISIWLNEPTGYGHDLTFFFFFFEERCLCVQRE